MIRHVATLSLALASLSGALPAVAQDFYAGKQLTFIVGSGSGGGYDLQARVAARHLGKHIPGNPHRDRAERVVADCGGQQHVQHGGERRHRDRATPARRAAGQADLSRRGALRGREIPLARQPQQRDRGDAGLAHGAAQDREGSVREGANRWRHQWGRSGDHAAALQQA